MISEYYIMFSWKEILCNSSCSVCVNNLILKILIPKYLIHLTLDIVTRMPVAVDIDRASRFEYPLHLPESRIEPGEIWRHPIFEYITEWSHFVLISPDLRIVPIREKWWIDIDEIYRLWWYGTENREIVPEIEFMRWEIWSSEPKSIISVMRIRGKEWRELYPWKYMIESRRWIISIGLDFRIWELSSCTSRFLQFFLREEFFLIWKGILFYFFGRIFRHKKALTKVNARIRWMFFHGWIPAYAGMTETKVGAWQKLSENRKQKERFYFHDVSFCQDSHYLILQ